MRIIFFLVATVLLMINVYAQDSKPIYTIIIKEGRVIDAKNNINDIMDVAIQEGKIVKVEKNINPALGVQIVNASGMFVTPGLIDLHAHVFWGTEPDHYLSNGNVGVTPDGFSFRSGVTTMVDCGGAGWKSFDLFKKNVIERSKTRIFSFLNIVGEGMRGKEFYEQDVSDMDVQMAVNTALNNRDYIVGFKLAHFRKPDWTPVEKIVEAGERTDMPVVIDFGGSLSIEALFFKYLRPGDIFTHVYRESVGRETVVDPQSRQLRPFVISAQKRGILFDVGFGNGSFNFDQAVPSIKAGFFPDLMGTDLHTGSMNGSMKDQLNVLSIHLAMGMDMPAVISRSTWEPAKAIRREYLGNLSIGAIADVAILSLRKGDFGFRDIANNRLDGIHKLDCEMTIKDGRIVYDLNAIAENREK